MKPRTSSADTIGPPSSSVAADGPETSSSSLPVPDCVPPATGTEPLPPLFVSTEEAQRLLGGVSRQTIWRAVKAGALVKRPIYPGGPRRITYASIAALAEKSNAA